MRKLILALTLSILLTPLALASFSDVSQTHKNRIAIEYLQEEEIISGYPDGTYRPENTINRAEMMKMLVEGLGITPDSDKYRNCFPDVGTEWYARYVCYAKEQNWVGGYPDGTFKPANNVLDVEAFKMILNARGVELDASFVPLLFATVSPNEWYRPYLVTAEKLNLTDYFKPGANYKRGQVAEVIFRTIVIDKMDVSSYSLQAQNEMLNRQTEKPEVSYEAASYIDYTAAKREAYEGTRPFAIFFYATSSSTCYLIENELLKNLDGYPDGVMILKADYDTETELRNEFKVTSQNWFVIFNGEGEVTFSNSLFNANDVIDEIIPTL
ncbi:S-layer homology domain-containing protein [Candidatus Peregrinibacteria bacterium]|nr:S-layer homology domain-containing protein [Candidatus Peregrinibacteria bacterium]